MGLMRSLRSLDDRTVRRFVKPYKPKPTEEARAEYLEQLANFQGQLGYADAARPALVELAREVLELRAQVEALRSTDRR